MDSTPIRWALKTSYQIECCRSSRSSDPNKSEFSTDVNTEGYILQTAFLSIIFDKMLH
ncbi:unnamed protein product [Haemonchus placei]|uniref:Uncharacterized protein n=1 Tax=Haemonchus placei TaxID=6290 RepID=A0A0N4W3J3_HAEPC|nr:unnamed protein product [Haemonchus placei]